MNPWFLYPHLHYIYVEPYYLGGLVKYVDVRGRVMDEVEDWSWIGGCVSFDMGSTLFIFYFYNFFVNFPVSPSEVQYLAQPYEEAFYFFTL